MGDTTAQALLNNITQPLAPSGTIPMALPSGAVSFAGGTPLMSSTIDMKSLGVVSTSYAPITTAPLPTFITTGPSVTSAALDLKPVIPNVDINALKWQQVVVITAPTTTLASTRAIPTVTSSAATRFGSNNNLTKNGTGPSTSMAIKRSSSVDSPIQDEERLTVVEADDSSQDAMDTISWIKPNPPLI